MVRQAHIAGDHRPGRAEMQPDPLVELQSSEGSAEVGRPMAGSSGSACHSDRSVGDRGKAGASANGRQGREE